MGCKRGTRKEKKKKRSKRRSGGGLKEGMDEHGVKR